MARKKTTKTKPAPTPQWASAIVGYANMSPSELTAHPDNFRKHPAQQRTIVSDLIDEVGVIQNVIFNKRTGRLIDGHLRVELAIERGNDSLPVTIVDLDEAKEAIILAGLDDSSTYAEVDPMLLRGLLGKVNTGKASLQEMYSSLLENSGGVDLSDDDAAEDEPEEEFEGVYELAEDAKFPSDNEWDLPNLREDMLGTTIPRVTWGGEKTLAGPASDYLFLWGKSPYPDPHDGGVLAFYVDDYRFEGIWNDAVATAAKLRKETWGAVIAPDFSLWRDDPLGVQLFNTFRARWCARYWQEVGVPVIPSLNWSDERTYGWVWKGYPVNAPVVALQCRTTRSDKGKEYFLKGLGASIEELRPQNVVIYGGIDHESWVIPNLPKGPEYHPLPSWMKLRRPNFKGG